MRRNEKSTETNIDRILYIVWICAAVLFLGLPLADEIGHTERAIVREIEEENEKLGGEYTYDVGESMIAALFYDTETERYECDIYVNFPGFSFGWFFRVGGCSTGMSHVEEDRIENIDDFVLYSTNQPRVCRIEIDDGTTVQSRSIDPDKPFVMILPGSTVGYTLYDENGEVVPAY